GRNSRLGGAAGGGPEPDAPGTATGGRPAHVVPQPRHEVSSGPGRLAGRHEGAQRAARPGPGADHADLHGIMSESPATSLTLLQRAQARQPAAWERLVDLYAPLVLHWC